MKARHAPGLICGLLLLQVLDAVKRYGSKDDEALEDELEVRIDAKECEAVCKRREYYDADYGSSYLPSVPALALALNASRNEPHP